MVSFVAFCWLLGMGGLEAQSGDDHGNYLDTATTLSLGSSINGRIDRGDDRDFFRLDLSRRFGATDVWIYTTGDFDTWGQLYDSAGGLLVVSDDGWIEPDLTNFHIRSVVPPGVYYVGVFSADDTSVGDYTLHARAVAEDLGDSISTAATLSLDVPTPGRIVSDGDPDYFRMDFTDATELVLYAQIPIQRIYRSGMFIGLTVGDLDVQVFDGQGNEIPVNIRGESVLADIEGVSYELRLYVRISDSFGPGTYYFEVTAPGMLVSPYTIHAYEDTEYAKFIDDCEGAARASGIADPLYGCQWHLNDASGEDINVEEVWSKGVTGEGVNVVVVDDGMDHTHEDLAANVDASRNHDYAGGGDIHHRYEHHGTNVAGVLAARDNSTGVRGVAPRATIYGYNVLVESTEENQTDAMTRNQDTTAVSNNSWGPTDDPTVGFAHSFWEQAIESGIERGYDGKGVFYAWAGGNGHLEGDYSNLDEYANFYGVTAVCAVNDAGARSDYSEKGPNLWVCAPSNDLREGYRGIVTVENSDRYDNGFGGTSAATPMVAGVAALLRSVNPDLTWRDLKLILAASARRNDVDNPGWEEGARKYGSDSDTDRYHFNHEYGFGVVDAASAADLAEDWNNAPPLQSVSKSSLSAATIPAPGSNGPETVTTKLSLDTEIQFVEFVEVEASFNHTSFRDMHIELVSPSGAVSKLTVPFDTRTDDDDSLDFVQLIGDFRFGSARHLGENPNGDWTLSLTDHFPIYGGTLDTWRIKIYGHSPVGDVPGAPANLAATANGETQIDLSWSAPSNPGGFPIIGYRIEVSEDSSSWNDLVADTGSVDTGYSHTGLTAGSKRYYRVSAINSDGTGPASNVVNATTDGTPPTELGTATGVTVTPTGQSGEVEVSWARAANATGYIIIAININDIGGDIGVVPLNDGGLDTGKMGGLSPGATYDIYVAATGSRGKFTLSDPARVTAE